MDSSPEKDPCIDEKILKRLCELAEYYRNEFLPVYADYVILLKYKPEEVLSEIENILSHVIKVLLTEVDAPKKNENIEKARAHIDRAILDCLKGEWIEQSEFLSSINGDEHLRRHCTNLPEHEFVGKYVEYNELLKEARRIELNSVGVNHQDTIKAYKRAIELSKELINQVDPSKISSFERLRRIISIKLNLYSFLIGVFASLMASYLWTNGSYLWTTYIKSLL